MSDSGSPVVTIQKTGKIYKAAMAAGVALMLVGVISYMGGRETLGGSWPGFGMFFGGLMLYAGARAMAWWKHG